LILDSFRSSKKLKYLKIGLTIGFPKKPMFTNRWYRHKTPELQIRILKLILTSGSSSKKKAATALHATYSVVSDSIKALEERRFIRFLKAS
jgi:hypothetical protein